MQTAMERQTSSERQSRMHGKTYQTFIFLQHRKALDLPCWILQIHIKDINSITTGFLLLLILLAVLTDLQRSQIMRLYARALKAKHRPKYSLGIICQWIGGLVNSPLLARSAYGSFVLCSRDESDTASRTKLFIVNSWRYFSEFHSVLDTTSIGAMHRIGVETSWAYERRREEREKRNLLKKLLTRKWKIHT